LHAARVESNPPRIRIDLKELRKRAGQALPMGFADEQDENLPDEARYLSVQVQPIYREWGVRESELDKVRPFFTNDALRAKILPLEIVRTVREDREVPSATARSVKKQSILTLGKRSSHNP
jgi:hypothetical protein